MDWKLKEIKTNNVNDIVLTAEARMDVAEFGKIFGLVPDGKLVKDKPKPAKEKTPRKKREGKRLKDMTIEEKRAYWRENAKKNREKKTIQEEKKNEVSEEKLEKMQALDNKIKKVQSEQNKLLGMFT